MKSRRSRRLTKKLLYHVFFVFFVLFVSSRTNAAAQSLSHRGFVEGTFFLFPQQAPNDRTRIVGDFLAREEAFFKPAPWIRFAGGLDWRANSHDQVEDRWRVDFTDRGVERPRLSIRRAAATLTRGRFTIDVGKQFIRWGKTDIINPTDRFAPRDFLNVVDSEFLAVTGARGVVQASNETFEGVWVPRFTPSRVPFLNQRWTAVPAGAVDLPIAQIPATLPKGAQTGLRWSHVGAGFELSASFFEGFNHLPNIETTTTFNAETAKIAEQPCSACSASSALIVVQGMYPSIRMYGADAAAPTRWFTIKGETAYFTSPSSVTDEYVLYVVQLERQTGEWVLVGGYAGEGVTARRAPLTFAPDRGMTRSLVGRASYTLDVNRSFAFEAAFRRNGDGAYAKFEYSEARGQHWRTTITGVGIAGHSDDFLGQYHRNSHIAAKVRYSF